MVDRKIIEKALETIEQNVRELQRATDITREKYSDDIRSRRFVERSLQVIIEACIDSAQHIIADENLREPVSYRDTFTVLVENRILPENERETFEKIAMFRNLLVHYYEKIDDTIVYGIFKNKLSDFKRYISHIIEFLDKE